MADSTLERPTTATEFTTQEERSFSSCRICSEFASEECDVLVDLARYRRTEAILKAAERHAARFTPRENREAQAAFNVARDDESRAEVEPAP